jgi:hypothetical protein
LPNALTIHHIANFDFRKEIVGGDFPEGPQGQRGAACANAKADQQGRRRHAASAESAVEGRGGFDRESLASAAGRQIRQFASCPRKSRKSP